MQVYNLGIDQATLKNNAEVAYEIINLVTLKQVVVSTEKSGDLSPNSDQLTLEKSLPLATVDPGKYQITIKVNDPDTTCPLPRLPVGAGPNFAETMNTW